MCNNRFIHRINEVVKKGKERKQKKCSPDLAGFELGAVGL